MPISSCVKWDHHGGLPQTEKQKYYEGLAQCLTQRRCLINLLLTPSYTAPTHKSQLLLFKSSFSRTSSKLFLSCTISRNTTKFKKKKKSNTTVLLDLQKSSMAFLTSFPKVPYPPVIFLVPLPNLSSKSSSHLSFPHINKSLPRCT